MVKSWKLPPSAGDFHLFGLSRAADSTSFCLPEIGVNLDAGSLVHTCRPERIFLSHTHTDHSHMLTHFVSRARPPLFVMPAESVDFVERYLRAAQELTNHGVFAEDNGEDKGGYQLNHVNKGVKAGEVVEFQARGRQFVVKVIDCDHSVPSIGFIFQQRKTKLRPEFQGKTGPELAELKKNKVEITQEDLVPLFAFMGDTTTKVFLEAQNHPELLRTPVIITECTFLTEDEAENAKRTKHSLWPNDLELVVKGNPQIFFILIHFSHRYKARAIKDFFDNERETKGITNFLVWLEEGAEDDGRGVHTPPAAGIESEEGSEDLEGTKMKGKGKTKGNKGKDQ